MSLLKAALVLAAMILLGAEARASGALFSSGDAPAAPRAGCTVAASGPAGAPAAVASATLP